MESKLFKMYDLVKAKVDLESVPRNSRGTIVLVYAGGKDFEVEFDDGNGNTLAILTVNKNDLKPVSASDNPQVNNEIQ